MRIRLNGRRVNRLVKDLDKLQKTSQRLTDHMNILRNNTQCILRSGAKLKKIHLKKQSNTD